MFEFGATKLLQQRQEELGSETPGDLDPITVGFIEQLACLHNKIGGWQTLWIQKPLNLKNVRHSENFFSANILGKTYYIGYKCVSQPWLYFVIAWASPQTHETRI